MCKEQCKDFVGLLLLIGTAVSWNLVSFYYSEIFICEKIEKKYKQNIQFRHENDAYLHGTNIIW